MNTEPRIRRSAREELAAVTHERIMAAVAAPLRENRDELLARAMLHHPHGRDVRLDRARQGRQHLWRPCGLLGSGPE